ncbi:hypothetical protein [Streptomyces sp. AC555_RSS877]|uniref:hypothetical protein n=1 Tax=Streptomyces sp. AC555_RSS877 TaxID=2823688 RepID=UPI001C2561F2|nr:hypothetical protein [Streptomyces sp. AC555_RSS877]
MPPAVAVRKAEYVIVDVEEHAVMFWKEESAGKALTCGFKVPAGEVWGRKVSMAGESPRDVCGAPMGV